MIWILHRIYASLYKCNQNIELIYYFTLIPPPMIALHFFKLITIKEFQWTSTLTRENQIILKLNE